MAASTNNHNQTMKKLLLAISLTCALVLATSAAEGDAKKKPSAEAEQKANRKALIEKYDTNKNGRLDKEERSKMTPEDQEKWNNSPAEKKKAPEAAKP